MRSTSPNISPGSPEEAEAAYEDYAATAPLILPSRSWDTSSLAESEARGGGKGVRVAGYSS